jgi:hypothetical protein
MDTNQTENLIQGLLPVEDLAVLQQAAQAQGLSCLELIQQLLSPFIEQEKSRMRRNAPVDPANPIYSQMRKFGVNRLNLSPEKAHTAAEIAVRATRT